MKIVLPTPSPLTEDVHVLAPDLGVVVREVRADLAAVEARTEQRHPRQDHRHAPSQELKQGNLIRFIIIIIAIVLSLLCTFIS